MLKDRITLTFDTSEVDFISDVTKFHGCSLNLLYLDTESLHFLCTYSNVFLTETKPVEQYSFVFRSYFLLSTHFSVCEVMS